ncbi:unnamed protein product [Paramecium pentaurelia]|uniref:Uncharacterized protein n=1 Tax=Paramecium pentaurelia TaxID=43138 RepID=A0A8S1TEU2_9CILI|nr:unnamed protein product [Paramecium pentaurelia]
MLGLGIILKYKSMKRVKQSVLNRITLFEELRKLKGLPQIN